MGDTYDSVAEAEADRAQQQALLAALNATERALRRDECGGWRINGRHDGAAGSIHTSGDGKMWAIFVACRSPQHWTWTKKKLAFCTVTQDGDDEGVLRLHQLPSVQQAETIRNVLAIPKRRDVSAEVLERLKAFSFERKPRREASLEQNNGQESSQPTEVPPEKAPILEAEPAK